MNDAENYVTDEDMGHMLAEIGMGIPKEESQYAALDPALWDQIAAEVAEIQAAGLEVEIPSDISLPPSPDLSKAPPVIPRDPVPEGTKFTATWVSGDSRVEWATFLPHPDQPAGQWDLGLIFRDATATIKNGTVPQPIVDKAGSLAYGAGYDVEWRGPDPTAAAGLPNGSARLELTQAPVTASADGEFAAVGIHHTATSESSWDGGANEKRLPSPMTVAQARGFYAFIDQSQVTKGKIPKSGGKFGHHEVSADGKPGPANLTACSSGIAVLNGGRGGTNLPADAKHGVYNHLAAHLKDAKREPPEANFEESPMAVTDVEVEVEEPVDETVNFDVIDDSNRFRSVLVVEGIPSGDGRQIEVGALTWRDLPLPLMVKTTEQGDGHDGAELAARIDAIVRDGSTIRAEGTFDDGPVGQELRRLVTSGMLRGVSVDLDSVEIEWENEPPGPDTPIEEMLGFDPGMMLVTAARIMGATVTPFPAFEEAYIELVDGSALAAPSGGTMPTKYEVDPADITAGDRVTMGDRVGEVLGMVEDPPLLVVQPDDVDAPELWDAAQCTPEAGAEPAPSSETPPSDNPFPPAAEVEEALVASASSPPVPLHARWNGRIGQALVASAAPVHPPAAWFERPPEVFNEHGEKIAYPVRVSIEGRIAGYVADWENIHIGLPGKRRPPRSPSNYATFRTGQTLTAEGTLVATGRIVTNTVHPKLRLAASDAAAWYADTGCAVGDVAVYEDEVGIMVAGACRPDATDEQLRIFRGSDISPDWRDCNGRLDCVGMMCCNASGFIVEGLVASANIVAPRGHTGADGRITALVAAGMIRRHDRPTSHAGLARRVDELEAVVASLNDEQRRPESVERARKALELLAD